MNLNESKHDSTVMTVVKDILQQLKYFNNSEYEEAQIDLPDEGEYYYTPLFYGETHSFYVELTLIKTNEDSYKIDGDSPGDIEDNDIRIAIYYNPKKLREQVFEIKNNLVYTVRHEYEHFLQTLTDYERVTYPVKHNYRKDSLSTLTKQREIEPQVKGYYLQSKKEKKPFDSVVYDHLDKLEKNKQVNFLSQDRKDIIVNILIGYAKKLKLPIKLSDDKI